MFCDQKRSGTPLERLRDSRGGQKPSSFPFGVIGFSKPAVLAPWKGQSLVLCVYLGMRYVTGGGVLVFPVNPDSEGNREVIRGHSFRIREGVQFDVQTVWPLLAGVIPNDPSVAPPFVDPRESLENPNIRLSGCASPSVPCHYDGLRRLAVLSFYVFDGGYGSLLRPCRVLLAVQDHLSGF